LPITNTGTPCQNHPEEDINSLIAFVTAGKKNLPSVTLTNIMIARTKEQLNLKGQPIISLSGTVSSLLS
jgi:hypothetical protein